MCGRYEFKILPSKIGIQIKEKAEELSLQYKEGEIFPGDHVLCIVPFREKTTMKSMKWGIVTNNFQINAKSEKINNSSFYKNMRNNRCGVIANGFYEWDKEKNKYYFDLDEEYMYLAAIYNEKNELLIVTKEADENMAGIHERMPVIMNMQEMLDYIRNDNKEISKKKLNITNSNNETKLF